jgi:hypothetical protein
MACGSASEKVREIPREGAMRIIECPVCRRRYHFDESKMHKQKISVKCRKCENIFVILKEMFRSSPGEMPPPPETSERPSSPPAENAAPMILVIEEIPDQLTCLKVAAKLMPFTGKSLGVLKRELSKTPVKFHFEMTPTEGENLLGAIKATGAFAECIHRDLDRRTQIRTVGGIVGGKTKRWLAAAVVTFFVCGGALSYYLYREIGKTQIIEERGITSVIPKGPLFYIRFRDLEENWAKIQDSPMGAGVQAFVDGLTSTPQVQDLLLRKQELESRIAIPFLHPTLMDFIGSDMHIGIYRVDGSEAPHFVLTVRVNSKIKLMETLGRWFSFIHKGISARRTDSGERVFAIPVQGMGKEIYYFSEGMVYLISTSSDLAERSRSLLNGQLPAKGSLASVSLLSEKDKRTGVNELGYFYANPRNIKRPWFGNASTGDGNPLSETPEGNGEVVGTISYRDGLVVESTMHLPRDFDDQPLSALLKNRPTENKTLRYIPENTIIYASNNSLDLASYFSWVKEAPKRPDGSSNPIENALSNIWAMTGVNIEKEILPFLGTEFSYALMAANEAKGFYFPAMQVFLEVQNRSKVESSLNRLLKSPFVQLWFKQAGIDFITTEHEGVPITTLHSEGQRGQGFPLLPAFAPGYAFVNDFLVIGMGPKNLKQMIDLSSGRGATLSKNGRFSESRLLFREKNNGMAYLDLQGISQLLDGMIAKGAWEGVGFTESRGKKAQDLLPYVKVLETLNYVRSETEFDRDRVRFLLYVGL